MQTPYANSRKETDPRRVRSPCLGLNKGKPVQEYERESVALRSLASSVPTGQPIEPSICNSMRRDHSTAYSIGRVRVTGSMNPLTIMPIAWLSVNPRLIK